MTRLSHWKAIIERLYEKHFLTLLRRAHRSLADSNKAADLVQQVFTRMLEKDREFEEESEAERFLYASFYNMLTDTIRMRIRWKCQGMDTVDQKKISSLPHQEDDFIRERLRHKTLPLSSRERYIFEMAYMEGKSDQQISDELHLSVYTVQRRLVQARKALEKILVSNHGYKKDMVRELFRRQRN